MKVIFGLGNPGLKYRYTRHNIGFLILDYLAHFFLKEFVSDTDLYKFTKVEIAGQDVLLVKPMTYMNLSGRAVSAVIEKYSIFSADNAHPIAPGPRLGRAVPSGGGGAAFICGASYDLSDLEAHHRLFACTGISLLR